MTQSSRRQFLENSLLATASAMAAQSRFSGVAVADDNQSPKIGPNDTIRVAVIGAGGRGGSHIGGFAGMRGTQVTHICDCDEKAGQNSCESASELQNGKKPSWVKDLRRLLDVKSKVADLFRQHASTIELSKPARRADPTLGCETPWPSFMRAELVTLRSREVCATNPVVPSAQKEPTNHPRTSTMTCGLALHRSCRLPESDFTTTGIGNGLTGTATSETKASIKWTFAVGRSMKIDCASEPSH